MPSAEIWESEPLTYAVSTPLGSGGDRTERAYARIASAFSEMTLERSRPWVGAAVRATFTPDEAVRLADVADRERSRGAFGLSPSSWQVIHAAAVAFPDRQGMVTRRARLLGIRSGAPVSAEEVKAQEQLARNLEFDYGLTAVILVVVVGFGGLMGLARWTGRLVLPPATIAESLGGVALLFLPFTLFLDRRRARKKAERRGTLRDPQVTVDILRRVHAGADPRSLISDTGDPVRLPR